MNKGESSAILHEHNVLLWAKELHYCIYNVTMGYHYSNSCTFSKWKNCLKTLDPPQKPLQVTDIKPEMEWEMKFLKLISIVLAIDVLAIDYDNIFSLT